MTAPDVTVVATQLGEARLDNRARWRSAGIATALLVITGIGIVLVPFIVLGVLIVNQNAETSARAGTYVFGGPRVNEQTVTRWIIVVVLAGAGVAMLMAAVNPLGYVLGAALILGGVALRPWRYSFRPPPPLHPADTTGGSTR